MKACQRLVCLIYLFYLEQACAATTIPVTKNLPPAEVKEPVGAEQEEKIQLLKDAGLDEHEARKLAQTEDRAYLEQQPSVINGGLKTAELKFVG